MSSPAIAIILAGGNGVRFGGDRPKQLSLLAGEPVIHHALLSFDQPGVFQKLVVVANPRWREPIATAAAAAIRRVHWTLVDGGENRIASLENAVASLAEAEARVLVHDAVRPLVSPALVRTVATALLRSRAVLPTIPSIDPMVEVADGMVRKFHSRAFVQRGQSPQGFHLSDLRAALADPARQDSPASETIYEMVQLWDPTLSICIVPGETNNLKITIPGDEVVAGQLLVG